MPPPVPPPPSNEALNGTVIDPLDQWQPNVSRYVHQQVSEPVWVGRALACFAGAIPLEEVDEERKIARVEGELSCEQSGKIKGEVGF